MRCDIRIGKLVSHPCGVEDGRECARCGRPACKRHRADGGICVVCAGSYAEPTAPIEVDWDEMWQFEPGEIAAFDARNRGRDALLHSDS